MAGLLSGTQGALTINTADVADDAITLAKMAPGTDGQILTYDASGNISAVGPGTDGQVLTSTGAGSPPAFEAAAGGAWNFISTTTFSSTPNYTFTGFNSATYDAYMFMLINVIPATDGVYLNMYTSTDGGSNYDSGSTDYNWVFNSSTVNNSDSGVDGDIDADDSVIKLTGDTSGAANQVGSGSEEHGVSGQIWLYDPASTKNTHGTYDLMYQSTTPESVVQIAKGGFARMSAADVDAIKIEFTSSSAIESGQINAYGVKNA